MRIKPGDKAPPFARRDSEDVLQRRTGEGDAFTLLCFFRYSGCPYCNLRVSEMIEAAARMEAHNIRVVTVFQSSKEHIDRDVGKQSPPFPIIPDPERELYKLYGVEPSWLKVLRAFFLRPLRAPYAIFAKGFIPRLPDGDMHMSPADFLIAPDGTVRLAYYGKDISDHVPLQQVYAAVSAAQRDAGPSDAPPHLVSKAG